MAGGIGDDNAYLDTVEIFDPNTGEWEQGVLDGDISTRLYNIILIIHFSGPALPSNRWAGRAVVNDEGVLLLVGGRISLDYEAIIWAFDEGSNQWITDGVGQLETPREYAAIFTVPEEAVGC